MPRRPTRPRRETRLTAKMTIEDLNAFVSDDPNELARIYGSLALARRRFDHLVETGQERRRPGQLSAPVWWLTEPGVPDELRSVKAVTTLDPDIADEYAGTYYADEMALEDTLELERWRWWAGSGRITDADRAALLDSARRSPNFRRVVRIAEAVQ